MGRSIMEVTLSEELIERAEEIMTEILEGRSWSGGVYGASEGRHHLPRHGH
jgi:hypothetical protein